ncbi:alpha/beta hydrolase family protein [Craterilacuibacter sinensis]|uniref:Alpha/beta fold hydrolase n=1 Tax=Craterilacuibacter sinensis TaxID=2686017 RepID=A0A845BHX9_9NEIS|nr:alpha/beta fold hydrolase [Craterilacuibacter sinensis]MXR35752.1 alpha/beta fold hydrolase [Craterilacuibacter sinensis]RQW29545.1 alpha/beta fold hydrolase [Rhodobacteraceae bacterium CH30]
MPYHEQSLYLPVSGGDTLHLRRIRHATRDDGAPVLLLHGVMGNGRIFYSDSGKGLAPWLAAQGYDCFVLDLRGRGQSTPKISRASRHGQTETITQDLPAAFELIRRLRPDRPMHWLAHSWGGVHMTSCLVRYPALLAHIESVVYFGSKRSVHVKNLSKLIEVDLMWNLASRLIIRTCGYLPARRIGLGADNESDKSHLHSKLWAKVAPWVDADDGFDYRTAAQSVTLPPTLYLAAMRDPCRGHVDDVRRFRAESGPHFSRVHLLAQKTGHRHDYDHVSLLTHPDAMTDHFPMVADWLSGCRQDITENI